MKYLKELGFSLLWALIVFSPNASSAEDQCSESAIISTIQSLPTTNSDQLDALASCGSPAVVFLIPALTDKNAEITYQTAYVLYLIASENRATPEMLQAGEVIRDTLLISPLPKVRERAARTLQAISPGDSKTVEALLSVFSNRNELPDVRQTSAEALASNSRGEKAVIDGLINAVIDDQDNTAVRSLAAYAISEIAKQNPGTVDTAVIIPLAKIIEDSSQDNGVVAHCIRAVDYIDAVDEVLIRSISLALDRQSPYVHELASIALSDLAAQLFRQVDNPQTLYNTNKK